MYQADSELHKDEGGICFVTLSHGIDEKIAEVGLKYEMKICN